MLRALIPEGVKIEKALARRRAELEQRVVEPVIVAWRGKLELPRLEAYRITLEGGQRFKGGVLPIGYHTLHIGRKKVAMIFSAPMKAPEPQPRMWGAFAPLYAIHTHRRWGIGDLGDMRAMQEWVHSIGGDFVSCACIASSGLRKAWIRRMAYTWATRSTSCTPY